MLEGKQTSRATETRHHLQEIAKMEVGKAPGKTGWWYTYPSEKYEFVSWDDYSKLNENK